LGKSYIVKEIEGKLYFDHAVSLKKPENIRGIDHPIRMSILRLLARAPMYPAELARVLGMHEQKVYYHIKQLARADAITVVGKRDIRGTTAKSYAPKGMNFCFELDFKGRHIRELQKEADTALDLFLEPFVSRGRLNSKIVVGSPDPHGPFKARARDGHYAIDLALYLGGLCSVPKRFSTMLDVDTDLKGHGNLILVGGPVTNLAMARVNDHLPARFSDKKPWGIRGKDTYTDDNIGLIAKIANPHFEKLSILVIAGIRYAGTKSAVLGLTRHSKLILSRYSGQTPFYAIVQGFDLDGDGRIDSVELLE
jgi:DNA-binding transcriptional ArsR family regulator